MTTTEKILTLIKNSGLSDYKLEQLMGLKRASINNWRADKAKPSADALTKIADYFDVSVDYLLGRETRNGNNIDTDKIIAQIGGEPVDDYFPIPLLGRVVAGMPIMSEENFDGYIYTSYKPPEEYFALRVFGDSMIGAGIIEGSILIVHKQSCADNGEIVVALLDNCETTVKRFKTSTNGTCFLMPENPAYDPIILNNGTDVLILGVVKEIRTQI